MTQDKEFTRGLLNYDEGAIESEFTDDDVLLIRSKAQDEFLKKTMSLNNEKRFTKIFDVALYELVKMDLTASEFKVILSMIASSGYDEFTCKPINIQNNCYSGLMNSKQLQAKTNLSDKTFSTTIKSLEDKKIIKIEKVGKNNTFIINPFIAMKGNRISKEIYHYFKNSQFNVRKN